MIAARNPFKAPRLTFSPTLLRAGTPMKPSLEAEKSQDARKSAWHADAARKVAPTHPTGARSSLRAGQGLSRAPFYKSAASEEGA